MKNLREAKKILDMDISRVRSTCKFWLSPQDVGNVQHG